MANKFISISSNLLALHKDQLIPLMQQYGASVDTFSSTDDIINNYLHLIKDNPSFRNSLHGIKITTYNNASGTTDPCDPSNPNAINNPSCPQYWMNNPAAQAQINAANNITNTSSNSKGSFGTTLGNILGSQQFQTVLNTAANAINNKEILKQQANQIKIQSLNLASQNNLGNINPTTGLPMTGSTGSAGKIIIILLITAGVGIGIYFIAKKKKLKPSYASIKTIPLKQLSNG